MIVEVRGKRYSSPKTAARFLGVSVQAVYTALHRGRMDTLGLGPGNRTNHRGGNKPHPFEMGGIRWPSMAQASVDLGFNRNHISQVMRKGGKRSKENLLRVVMEYDQRTCRDNLD